MNFEFAVPRRIMFGPGKAREWAQAGELMGRRALVITGKNRERVAWLMAALTERGSSCVSFSISTEPTIALVQEGVLLARREQCDWVVGIGGGSVLDAGKAIAAMIANPGDVLDYLEVIGKAQPLTRPSVPYVAIPTTAGTGTETTRNAVLTSPEHRVKASLRGHSLLPKLAIVDPELSRNLPRDLTAATGLDALTQLIESFVSSRANAVTDGLCREGLSRAGRALPRVCANGQDVTAREEMAVASLFSGITLANAGLGAVHGFAAPIGGMFPAPHGAVCAVLLPHVMEINLRALRERQPENPALHRYEEVACLVTGNSRASTQDGLNWVQQLCGDLEIPKLSAYGMRSSDLEDLVRKGKQASSMKANPIVLADAELKEILEKAL